MDDDARSAVKKLLAWCKYDPNDNGLPHLVFRDERVVTLEAALLDVQELAEAPPSREWVNPAWGTWGRAAAILKAADAGAGRYGPTAPAVIFTSLALQWVGHRAATPDAISMELRKDPEFRERISR
jgi:hypothetical protein